MGNISFSIVVATKSRVRLLTELIESIDVARKNYPGDCEVLIVDDSVPDESEAVREVCGEHDCKYIFYENGVSAKRNYGVRQAKNDEANACSNAASSAAPGAGTVTVSPRQLDR